MSKMTIGTNGLNLIKGFESLRLDVYKCPAGIPTVGFGHVVLPNEPYRLKQKITLDDAMRLLRSDCAKFEKAVSAAIKVPLSQNQFDACVSLAFNIGADAFASSSVAREINRGNFESAAERFLLWRFATVNGKKTVLRGLVRRREAERELFLKTDDATD